MNVVVDYPEEFPLVGIDRKVFDHRVRRVFAQPDAYSAHALDRLAERLGLKSRYHSTEYDELEALFTLARTEPDQAVLDQLLVRAGDFLLVRLRFPEFPSSSDEAGPRSSQIPLSWIVAGAAVFVAVMVAAFIWGAPAVASVVDSIVGSSKVSRPSVPLAATVTPTSSEPAFNVARPANAPASTVSPLPVDGTSELTLTTWTRDPLAAMDGIKRLMPKTDGSEYQIDVTVSQTSPPQVAKNTGDARK
ncbi:hypothetical protein C6Q14_27470 [Burkholderia ambifaria]|uniref:hypothetical protein n=1 Tax=Burkholderia ambifaria TaxID=152480 RepID=UPI000CFF29FC|nr:hypothetical protein [Burkholderia ambifaria]MBR8186508.1 hypothetical protein [Burkholderia ambifaria]PRF98075.1 hypothetical protein C6Q14_27470 [Burkholderia ambifaria]